MKRGKEIGEQWGMVLFFKKKKHAQRKKIFAALKSHAEL